MKCKTLLTISVPTTKWLGSEGRNLTLNVCADPQNSLSLWEILKNKQQRWTHGFCKTWMATIPYTGLTLPTIIQGGTGIAHFFHDCSYSAAYFFLMDCKLDHVYRSILQFTDSFIDYAESATLPLTDWNFRNYSIASKSVLYNCRQVWCWETRWVSGWLWWSPLWWQFTVCWLILFVLQGALFPHVSGSCKFVSSSFADGLGKSHQAAVLMSQGPWDSDVHTPTCRFPYTSSLRFQILPSTHFPLTRGWTF